MVDIYCGNKGNFTGLMSGTHILGTNYQCLRKGIGVGSNLPYDEKYRGIHVAIDDRKYYCGNSPVLPIGGGHFAIGSPSKCLAVGIGIGKAQRARMGAPAFMYFIRYILPYIIFFVLVIIIFSVFYLVKPKFLIKKDQYYNDIIDWGKFIPYYLLFCLIIFIFIVWFWRNFVRRWI